MAHINLKIDAKQFEDMVKNVKQIPDKIVKQGYDFFYKTTPIKTGNARHHTMLDSNSKTIYANYPYAERLDTGWSKQAPKGMSEPTIQLVEKLIENEIRKE